MYFDYAQVFNMTSLHCSDRGPSFPNLSDCSIYVYMFHFFSYATLYNIYLSRLAVSEIIAEN